MKTTNKIFNCTHKCMQPPLGALIEFAPSATLPETQSILYGNPQAVPSEKWFHEWLIGFIEGDGSFTVSKRGDLQFVITQGYQNIHVLYYIKMKLNLGRVVKQGVRTFRFVVQDEEGLKKIINFVNGWFVLPKTKRKLEKFIHAFNDHYCSSRPTGADSNKTDLLTVSPSRWGRAEPSLENAWIAGFTDAEGCFSISYVTTKKKFNIRYLVSQQDDLTFLKQVFAGIGAVEYNKRYNCYSFVIGDWSSSKKRPLNIDIVIEYFRINPLLTTKRNSYALWFYLQNQIFHTKMTPEKQASVRVLCKLINENGSGKEGQRPQALGDPSATESEGPKNL
uniref:LAGLIDADG homing endonuclease n=1 Tax=Marophrys sp. SRT127 TaxID=2488311 RepID=A0A455REF8_9EUKA|nr:LAGLIDADG homing endonuclease [Marophrys sp. SRT127]